jgi:hypothetical protein
VFRPATKRICPSAGARKAKVKLLVDTLSKLFLDSVDRFSKIGNNIISNYESPDVRVTRAQEKKVEKWSNFISGLRTLTS